MKRHYYFVYFVLASALWLSHPPVSSAASARTETTGSPTFFVATNGNDQWSGTRDAANSARTDGPFATVPRAMEATRKWRATATGTDKPVTIFLRRGTYFLERPLVFRPEDSGLVVAGYRNEKPVISGGRRIGSWKAVELSGRKAWAADLAEVRAGKWNFRELWVNGRRAVRARHPNSGYLKVADVMDKSAQWSQGQARFRFGAGDLPTWNFQAETEIVVMNRWVESRLPIRSIDDKERVVNFGKRAVFQLGAGDPYYLEGALEALDQPGEWVLDRAGGKLYYVSRAGESLATAEVVAPVLAQVVRFEGQPEAGKFVENITFRGITFAHTEWYFPEGFASDKTKPEVSPPPQPEVGGFAQAAVGVPGAVRGEGVRRCLWDACEFTHLGNYGVELARGCKENKITHSEFYDLGAGGVKLGETSIRSAVGEQTSANEISDCYIHDGGRMFHSAIGIWIGQSSDNLLAHNLIHDFYYTGISVGWTWGYGQTLTGNNRILYNHVHHIGVRSDGDGPILSDMGGIYTLGMQPGTRIENNLWHDIAGLQYGGWGIYLDEGSSSIVVRSNVVYRTTHGGFHQHYGATNQVQNNIFAFARDQQIQRSRSEPHISFYFTTNIVLFDRGVLLGSEWSNDKYEIDWNVYWDARPDAVPSAMQFAGVGLEQWRARKHDLHSQIADPLFRAPRQGDFRFRNGSPALKMGFQPIDLSRVGTRNGGSKK